MTLSQQKTICGLGARCTPAGATNTTAAIVGSVSGESRSHPLANVVFASKITAAANGNVATLTPSSGAIAQTTGSPVIERSAKDFQGITLPTSVKLHGIRIRTAADNAGTVTLGGSNSSLLPACALGAGCDLVLAFPAAGVTLAGGSTLSFTFSNSGDDVFVEFLGKTA